MTEPEYRNLFLTQVDPERRAVAIRAVKLALMEAGLDAENAMIEAEKQVLRVARGLGPAGLIHEDGDAVPKGTVARALAVFNRTLEASPGAAVVVADVAIEAAQPKEQPPLTETPEPVDGSWQAIERRFMADPPEDFEPSPEAIRTALALMSMADGQAQKAWFYAKLFAHSTGDQDLYVEVSHLFTLTYPVHKVGVV